MRRDSSFFRFSSERRTSRRTTRLLDFRNRNHLIIRDQRMMIIWRRSESHIASRVDSTGRCKTRCKINGQSQFRVRVMIRVSLGASGTLDGSITRESLASARGISIALISIGRETRYRRHEKFSRVAFPRDWTWTARSDVKLENTRNVSVDTLKRIKT